MAETETKKKYKGGPSRKSYLQNMAGANKAQYLKYADYSKKAVHDSDITYQHRGRNTTITRDSKSPAQWVSELVNREGKVIGDAFRHQGSLYKIKAGPVRGTYGAEKVNT